MVVQPALRRLPWAALCLPVRFWGRKSALTALAAGAALASPVAARASSESLSRQPLLDEVASDVAGFPVEVDTEDDTGEWAGLVAPYAADDVLGFTYATAPESDPRYRRIFLGPSVRTTLDGIVANGIESVDRFEAAVAIMTLIHEANHQALQSADEGRVNACALEAFPRVIANEFHVSQTVTQSSERPVVVQVRVRRVVRVRVGGRWVRRVRYVTAPRRTYEAVTKDVPNPVYTELVAESRAFYDSQPAPYSTGTCS